MNAAQIRKELDAKTGVVAPCGCIRVCPIPDSHARRDAYQYIENSPAASMNLIVTGAENAAVLASSRMQAIKAYGEQRV